MRKLYNNAEKKNLKFVRGNYILGLIKPQQRRNVILDYFTIFPECKGGTTELRCCYFPEYARQNLFT